MPLIVALTFGMIDFGWAFNDWIAMRQGSRDGARHAVTGRIGNETCTITGTTPASGNRALVCMVKHRMNLDPTFARVAIDVEGPYAAKKSISICTMYGLQSVTGFYGSLLDDKVVTSEVQMSIEQLTTDANTALAAPDWHLSDYQETPLGSNDWSWCVAEATL